jgi:hypothetical protein
MPALSIPLLKAETFLGIQDELDRVNDAFKHPLFSLFGAPVGYDSDTIELRVRQYTDRAGEFTSADGPAHLVREGAYQVITVEPLYTRPMARISNSEKSLYRDAGEVALQAPGSRALRSVMEKAEDVSGEAREILHNMFSQALQGTGSYRLGGSSVSVDYGLTALTPPSVDWSNAAATIAQDIMSMKAEFYTNAGVNANVVVGDLGTLWTSYFSKNTDFITFLKDTNNKGMADFFWGLSADAPPQAGGALGIREATMFGMRWIDCSGSFVDKQGNTVQRWPADSLSLIHMAPGMKKTLEWGAVKDDYTPTGAPNWEIFEQDEPKGTFARYAANGAAVIRHHKAVQTAKVVA